MGKETVTPERKDNRLCISIAGDAKIYDVAEIHKQILTGLSQVEDIGIIEVDCIDVENVDTSFLQLMLSLVRHGEDNNCTCRFLNVSSSLVDYIKAAYLWDKLYAHIAMEAAPCGD